MAFLRTTARIFEVAHGTGATVQVHVLQLKRSKHVEKKNRQISGIHHLDVGGTPLSTGPPVPRG